MQLNFNLKKTNKQRLKNKVIKGIFTLILYISLIGLAFVFIYPFLYMIVTSFKSSTDLNDISVTWLINELRFNNYKTAFKALSYPTRLGNTVMVVLLSVIGHIVSCSFIGYGFARYNFKFKGFWLAFLILSIIIPTETIIVPIYIFFSRFGLIGTYLPIILPSYLGFGLRGALFVFIYNQFFLSLPKELEEAAAIDGAGALKTYFYIALPNATASSLITLVLGIVWHWNDTFEPSMYIESQKLQMLPQMLPNLYSKISSSVTPEALMNSNTEIFNEAVVMAATTLVVVPLIIFYALVQSKFMVSVERSGITG